MYDGLTKVFDYALAKEMFFRGALCSAFYNLTNYHKKNLG